MDETPAGSRDRSINQNIRLCGCGQSSICSFSQGFHPLVTPSVHGRTFLRESDDWLHAISNAGCRDPDICVRLFLVRVPT